MNKLSSQYSDISEIYTHHIDLLHYCLKCPVLLPSLVNQVLDLWLIESGGDIKPLLPFNYDKVVRRLLVREIFTFYDVSFSVKLISLQHIYIYVCIFILNEYTSIIREIIRHSIYSRFDDSRES